MFLGVLNDNCIDYASLTSTKQISVTVTVVSVLKVSFLNIYGLPAIQTSFSLSLFFFFFGGTGCTAVWGPRSYFRPAARSLTSGKGAGVALSCYHAYSFTMHGIACHNGKTSFTWTEFLCSSINYIVITETTQRRVVK